MIVFRHVLKNGSARMVHGEASSRVARSLQPAGSTQDGQSDFNDLAQSR